MGIKAVYKKVKENIPFWNEKLPEIPDLVYDYLKTGRKSHEQQTQLINQLKEQQNKQHKQLIFTIAVSAIIICLAIFFH